MLFRNMAKVFERIVTDPLCQRYSRKLLKTILFLSIVCGFTLQSYNVCLTYFMYKTISVVSIEDHEETQVPPVVVVCVPIEVRFQSHKLREGEYQWSLGEIF